MGGWFDANGFCCVYNLIIGQLAVSQCVRTWTINMGCLVDSWAIVVATSVADVVFYKGQTSFHSLLFDIII